MISRAASPMACTPVAQAVTALWFGPLNPYLIDRWPDPRLISADGMKNGEMRRALPWTHKAAASAIDCSPPMLAIVDDQLRVHWNAEHARVRSGALVPLGDELRQAIDGIRQ